MERGRELCYSLIAVKKDALTAAGRTMIRWQGTLSIPQRVGHGGTKGGAGYAPQRGWDRCLFHHSDGVERFQRGKLLLLRECCCCSEEVTLNREEK